MQSNSIDLLSCLRGRTIRRSSEKPTKFSHLYYVEWRKCLWNELTNEREYLFFCPISTIQYKRWWFRWEKLLLRCWKLKTNFITENNKTQTCFWCNHLHWVSRLFNDNGANSHCMWHERQYSSNICMKLIQHIVHIVL